MAVPTTKEELEMLFKSIHKDCHTTSGGHCDLNPLIDKFKSSEELQILCMILAMGGKVDPLYAIQLAVCHGIKIGYQIRNPETVSARSS